MHGQNSGRAGRDEAFDLSEIQVVRQRIDIAKNGRNLLPLQGMDRGHEGEGGNNDFAPEIQRPNQYFESDGRIAHGDTMWNAEPFADALLEFPLERAAIREISSIDYFVDALE
jgi:hypothetical protein